MYCSNIFTRYCNTSFFTAFSDHIFIRLLHLPFHEVCQGDVVHDAVDGVVQFLPEQNGDALVGAAAVGAVFDAVDRGKAAFGQPKDHAYGVLLRLPFQGVAACRAADAFYKTGLI